MIRYHLTLVSLCSVLFWSNFVHYVTAEVVQAYRTPSEADLQWLFGDTPGSQSNVSNIPSVSGPSNIVQTGYRVPGRENSCDPCMPVDVPRQSIPPAPKAMNSKVNAGLVPEEDGVISISPTVIGSVAPVVQMSGDRLPPPTEVPREQNLPTPSANSIAEQLPMPGDRATAAEPPNQSPENSLRDFGVDISCDNSWGWDLSGGHCHSEGNDAFCTCFTCIICGDYRSNKKHSGNPCRARDDGDCSCNSYSGKCPTVFSVPDMVGGRVWYTGHQLPTMLLTRPNVGEHFNAGVQDRIWTDFRYWNNAVATENARYGVEQYTFGLEKKIKQKSSVEIRVPLVYQLASNQAANEGAMAVELGNVSVFLKQVAKQTSRWTISGGCGGTLATAKDWQGTSELNNNIYYLASFLGVQWHPNKNVFGHFVVQADVSVDGNRQKIGGQQVIHTGLKLGRWIYRADNGTRPCRLGGFTEVNYAAITEGTAGSGMLQSNSSTLTAAVGMPMVFGEWTCTNSLILPIQIDDRLLSVGYNFSMTRRF